MFVLFHSQQQNLLSLYIMNIIINMMYDLLKISKKYGKLWAAWGEISKNNLLLNASYNDMKVRIDACINVTLKAHSLINLVMSLPIRSESPIHYAFRSRDKAWEVIATCHTRRRIFNWHSNFIIIFNNLPKDFEWSFYAARHLLITRYV